MMMMRFLWEKTLTDAFFISRYGKKEGESGLYHMPIQGVSFKVYIFHKIFWNFDFCDLLTKFCLFS